MFTLNHTYLSNNSRPISPFAAALAIAIALAAYCTSHATVASTEPVKDSGGLPVDLSVFAVTGEETDPLTVSFSNGDKTVTFIPMIHIATPDFYKAVAEKVKELKGKGATLYYEYVDFDVLDENNKRKVRAMVAFLPTPDMYNEISDDGYIGQRIGDFLGLVNDKDVNVDVTAEELIQAYEEEFGPIEVTGPDATSDISEMATTILPQENVEKIILSTRNKKIADAISYSAGALCHVTSGGDGQEAIYRTDGDRRRTYGFSPSMTLPRDADSLLLQGMGRPNIYIDPLRTTEVPMDRRHSCVRIRAMRLTEAQRQILVAAIRGRDPEAEIYLYGSRANDEARGGDIDLLVISKQIDLMAKLDILGEIHQWLGDRRVDLVVTADPTPPFMRIARAEGIRL